jgi:DNA-binding MarR family transcriptional regulator
MNPGDSSGSLSTDDPRNAVLVALRRIIRATDIYSQKLRKTVGLTTPQLLVLRAASLGDEISLGRIASELKLSQATVTNIVDRLEGRDLLTRDRSVDDKRRINVHLTAAGRTVLDEAPGLLQERFVERFSRLPDWERSMIVAALQRTAALMDADEIDAAPVLYTGDVVAPR